MLWLIYLKYDIKTLWIITLKIMHSIVLVYISLAFGVGGSYFKGIVYPKMKILSLITYPHVFPNPLDLLCSEHKLRYF